MFRSCSRDNLRTGSAAFLSWPSTLSLRLMRLFEHLRFKDAGPHTLSTAAKLQPLRPPVSWASAHYRLCRCNHKAGAWKMHANLADLTITAADHDLMDVRGDQFTDNRVASSIVRRHGNGLARFPTDGILRIDAHRGDRCGIPCYIKRLLRAHLASPAMADGRNALGPSQEPRKTVEAPPPPIRNSVARTKPDDRRRDRRGRRQSLARTSARQPASDPANRNARAADQAGWAPPPSLRRDRGPGQVLRPKYRETPQATRRASSRRRCWQLG